MRLPHTHQPLVPRVCCARHRDGFTLLEILIVGALIALFAGIALVSYQRFYVDSKRKTIFDETKQIGVAAAFAEQDVSFIPRLHLLSLPKSLVTATATTPLGGSTPIVRPAMDIYGFLPESSVLSADIYQRWTGNYLGSGEARSRLTAGNNGLVKMRLPERSQFPSTWANKGVDVTLADWPIDAWGNPYVVYAVVADSARSSTANRQGLRLITRPTEIPNYMCAIVSYGPNHVPGGQSDEFINDGNVSQADRNAAVAWRTNMKHARLYIVNNANTSDEPAGTLTDNDAGFTLRSVLSTNNVTQFNPDFFQYFADSMTNQNPTAGSIAAPGIKDTGSDDIIWTF